MSESDPRVLVVGEKLRAVKRRLAELPITQTPELFDVYREAMYAGDRVHRRQPRSPSAAPFGSNSSNWSAGTPEGRPLLL